MDVLNTLRCYSITWTRFLTLIAVVGWMPAINAADEVKTQVASLVAGPQVCVRDKGKTMCEMEAALIWEVPELGQYCLWDENSDKPIQCWTEAASGTVKLKFVGDTSRTFRLTRLEQRAVLASTTIKVMGALEQRLRARRRNRIWRVF